jgi:CarD family transcriptional regulator
MRNGGLMEVAEVLKGLLKLQIKKPLSFREKKMLDKARHMLIMEVSIARSVREPEAIDLLQAALIKAGLELPPAL